MSLKALPRRERERYAVCGSDNRTYRSQHHLECARRFNASEWAPKLSFQWLGFLYCGCVFLLFTPQIFSRWATGSANVTATPVQRHLRRVSQPQIQCVDLMDDLTLATRRCCVPREGCIQVSARDSFHKFDLLWSSVSSLSNPLYFRVEISTCWWMYQEVWTGSVKKGFQNSSVIFIIIIYSVNNWVELRWKRRLNSWKSKETLTAFDDSIKRCGAATHYRKHVGGKLGSPI